MTDASVAQCKATQAFDDRVSKMLSHRECRVFIGPVPESPDEDLHEANETLHVLSLGMVLCSGNALVLSFEDEVTIDCRATFARIYGDRGETVAQFTAREIFGP